MNQKGKIELGGGAGFTLEVIETQGYSHSLTLVGQNRNHSILYQRIMRAVSWVSWRIVNPTGRVL